MKYIYIFVLSLLTIFNSYAITWGKTEVDDPIKLGSKCDVDEPASSGSYIYNWPSKYDQVFWPFTSSRGIWYCKDSGFIAFIGDFEDISLEEKDKISKYIETKDKAKVESLIDRLELLEAIYLLRNKGDKFNNRLKRIFAYVYEQDGEIDRANNYRKESLKEINEALNTDLDQDLKLEYLYVAANYERQFGDVVKSDLRLVSLREEIQNLEDETLTGFGEYLLELSEKTLLIENGGELAPKSEKNDG